MYTQGRRRRLQRGGMHLDALDLHVGGLVCVVGRKVVCVVIIVCHEILKEKLVAIDVLEPIKILPPGCDCHHGLAPPQTVASGFPGVDQHISGCISALYLISNKHLVLGFPPDLPITTLITITALQLNVGFNYC